MMTFRAFFIKLSSSVLIPVLSKSVNSAFILDIFPDNLN